MATVNSASGATGAFDAINAANRGTANTSTSTAEEAQDRFLKLLVTQLKNQDPLNPLENAEVTTQLAQMSTVSGIQTLNATLNSLVENIGSSQSMQAAAMIGKNVLVPGANMTLSNGMAYAGLNLAGAADQVTVTITDSAGNVVATEKLGAQKAGVLDIAWDGTKDDGSKVSSGDFKFTVEAAQGGSKVAVSALQLGTVSALVRSSGGFLLDLGARGTYSFDDVQQIL